MKNKMKTYKKLMRQCLNIAKKGRGNVEPNPCVGAIVYDEEKQEVISIG